MNPMLTSDKGRYWWIDIFEINGQIGEGDKKLDGMLIEEVW